MPAAELSRLRSQISVLIARFTDPPGLLRALRDLLDLYANRAYRAGQTVKPQPLLPSYRVAPLIMHELERELSRACQEQPEQALAVVEELWRDPNLEPRMLAVILLGAIPASQGPAVVLKLRAWAQPEENFRMLDALFKNGTTSLRRSAPGLLIDLYEEWIGAPKSEVQALGLRGLAAMVDDSSFENLPPVFRLIGPLVQIAPAPLQTDLLAVLTALSRRSPTETAFFLRQSLGMSSQASTARLVRRCMPLLGPAEQASLRSALQAAAAK